jgi:hypothetical protein
MLACLALFSRHLPSPDDGVYDYIGWVVSDGGTLYVDASDQNFPGMMLIHTLSATLFGHGLYSYRALDAIILAATCLGIAWLFRKKIGNPAAIWFAALYVAVYVSQDAWMVGQREIICAPLLLIASWVQINYLARERDDAHLEGKAGPAALGRWLPSSMGIGLLVGVAVLIRPTMLAHWGVLALVDLAVSRRLSRRFFARHAVALGTAACLLGLFALLGARSGATRQWYEDAVRFNLQVYGVHGAGGGRRFALLGTVVSIVKHWIWLWLFAAAGFWWLRKRDGSVALHVAAVAVTTFISYFAQGKGFGYHLGPLWIVGTFFFAYAMAQIGAGTIPAIGSTRLTNVVRVAILAVTVLIIGRKVTHANAPLIRAGLGRPVPSLLDAEAGETGFSFADAKEVARRVQSEVPEGETVLVWGRPEFINLLSNRKSPSRFASFAMLDEPRSQFVLYPKWEAELRRNLTQPGPKLICLFKEEAGSGYRYMPKPGDPGGMSRVVEEALRERYRLSFGIGIVDCYERT